MSRIGGREGGGFAPGETGEEGYACQVVVMVMVVVVCGRKVERSKCALPCRVMNWYGTRIGGVVVVGGCVCVARWWVSFFFLFLFLFFLSFSCRVCADGYGKGCVSVYFFIFYLLFLFFHLGGFIIYLLI